jgi:hypothetical protein
MFTAFAGIPDGLVEEVQRPGDQGVVVALSIGQESTQQFRSFR